MPSSTIARAHLRCAATDRGDLRSGRPRRPQTVEISQGCTASVDDLGLFLDDLDVQAKLLDVLDGVVDDVTGVLAEYEAIRGVLLENHGVLTFGDSLNTAIRANMTIEESAEILLNAYKLGGPKLIPREMITATRERAAGFAAAGTQTAEQPRS